MGWRFISKRASVIAEEGKGNVADLSMAFDASAQKELSLPLMFHGSRQDP